MHVVAPEVVDLRAHRVSVLDGVAVHLDVLGQHVDSVGGRRQHADALLGGEAEALGLGAGQVHPGVGLLVGLRQDPAGRDVPEVALPRELAGGLPDLRDHVDGLVPAVAGLAGVDALAQLLVGIGAASAELHPPVGELVNHSGPLGDADGVVVGQDGHAEADADVLGSLGESAEHHLGAGGAGEAVQEVVLHETRDCRSNLVGNSHCSSVS